MEYDARNFLLARQYAYSVLHRSFGQAPSEQVLAVFLGKESLETLEALAVSASQEYVEAVASFAALKDIYLVPKDSADLFKSLELEYTRLFLGPHALEAPPWEMIYVTGRRELFQPGVLDIRAIYRSEGCVPAEAPHVSDDHLGIELDFMRFLCKKTVEALEREEDEEATRLEQAQLTFLTKHILTWVPRYLDDFEAAAKEPFYCAVARLLRTFIALDAQLLEADVEGNAR